MTLDTCRCTSTGFTITRSAATEAATPCRHQTWRSVPNICREHGTREALQSTGNSLQLSSVLGSRARATEPWLAQLWFCSCRHLSLRHAKDFFLCPFFAQHVHSQMLTELPSIPPCMGHLLHAALCPFMHLRCWGCRSPMLLADRMQVAAGESRTLLDGLSCHDENELTKHFFACLQRELRSKRVWMTCHQKCFTLAEVLRLPTRSYIPELEIGATKARNAADKQAFFESGAGPDQDGGGSLKREGGGATRGGGGPPPPRNQLRRP